MAALVRQVKKHQLSDWFTDVYAKCKNAEHQLSTSSDVRQESRYLRNETDSQTKWDQYSTEVRLADRIDHMRKCKEKLERIVGRLDQEIAELSEAKETSENALAAMNFRTDIAIECLTLRDGRRNYEVIEDQTENQLHKEIEVTEGLKKCLQQRISDAFEQLCLLQEARQQVQENLQDKSNAISIDIDQYNLTDRSPGITYKTDPLHVPKGSTTCHQWSDFSSYVTERAETELKSAVKLKELMNYTLQNGSNVFEAQRQATEYAFRKRMHEYQRAVGELEWLKRNTEEEIAEIENDIRGLQESIRQKNRATMKAETRLTNRSYNINVEKCCDAVHFGLVDEAYQLGATTKALEEKLQQAQHALDGLYKSLRCLNSDIALKNHTLRLDNQCMNIRQKLNPPTTSNTQNNLNLMGNEKTQLAILN